MELTVQKLAEQLGELPEIRLAIFGASCCERLLPNYGRFALEVNWGDIVVLRSSLDTIWLAIGEDSFDFADATRLSHLISSCESVTPDTEQFSSRYTSAALDAASAVVELLEFCIDRSVEHIRNISTLSFDSVDMFVQDILDIDYADTDFEIKIREHPLMVKELRRQCSDLQLLQRQPKVDGELLAFFRNQSSNFEI